jgi:hypothetical protein
MHLSILGEIHKEVNVNLGFSTMHQSPERGDIMAFVA